MRITIENSVLCVTVESFGAELKSACSLEDGKEFMWQDNPQIWSDTAPFLFPVVARQLNDSYYLNGRRYEMPMHGFAKDRDFEITDQKADSVTLTLHEDEETLSWYPFRFTVKTTFSLCGRELHVSHTVENNSNSDMPFSIGEHPGFAIPMEPGESIEDYYLDFSHTEMAERFYLDDEIICGSEPYLNGNILPIRYDTFNRGALIFKGLRSDRVTLRGRNHSRSVSVDLSDWRYLGIWAKPHAEYVCIEPWNGLASSVDSSSNIWEKEGIMCLAPKKNRRFTMNIRFDW